MPNFVNFILQRKRHKHFCLRFGRHGIRLDKKSKDYGRRVSKCTNI